MPYEPPALFTWQTLFSEINRGSTPLLELTNAIYGEMSYIYEVLNGPIVKNVTDKTTQIASRGPDHTKVPGPDPAFKPGYEYECPISHDFCFEPVAVCSARGIIQYYEREELVSWCEHCIERDVKPFAPHTREPIHFETAADIVVDEKAKRILDDYRNRAATGGE